MDFVTIKIYCTGAMGRKIAAAAAARSPPPPRLPPLRILTRENATRERITTKRPLFIYTNVFY